MLVDRGATIEIDSFPCGVYLESKMPYILGEEMLRELVSPTLFTLHFLIYCQDIWTGLVIRVGPALPSIRWSVVRLFREHNHDPTISHALLITDEPKRR